MGRTTRRSGFMMVLFILLGALFIFPGAGPVQAKKIKLSQTKLYLAKGDTQTLKISGTKKKVTWKTSNKKVAAVTKKGKVTAKKTGKATITARVGGKNYKCKVTVEDKARNRARRLRDHILSKGDYYADSGSYYWKAADLYDEETDGTTEVRLEAYKKNQKIKFMVTFREDAPANSRTVTLTIDLINGTKKVRTGEVSYHYSDAYSDYENTETEGSVTTKYTYAGKGLTVEKYGYYLYGEPEDSEDTYYNEEDLYAWMETADPEILEEAAPKLTRNLNAAFAVLDQVFGQTKALKKYKISMKSIGFTKWKNETED